MPREFRLPELAESVVEGEIVQWLVAEGEEVTEDQPIVEVMTDKVTVELPSPFVGVLQKQLVKEGDVVPVNTPIAVFADVNGGEEASGADTGPADAAAAAASGAASTAPPEDEGDSLSLFKASGDVDKDPIFQVKKHVQKPVQKQAQTATDRTPSGPSPERVTGPYGRVLAVPAARKLARELGVDLATVSGSGPNGRIRVEDVRAHAADGSASPARTPSRYQTPEGYGDLEERLPMRGLRRAISNQMMASHLQTVRALHVDEADVSALVSLRTRLKERAAERGVRLSYLPFVMKAVVSALQAFPMVNASYDEEQGEIVRKHYYNLGMAVATDQGLVVPVVEDVDSLSLLEVAAEVQRLAEAARTGNLAPGDMRGGTFSITNIGTVGGLFSFPIINVPEAAILGVHSIKKRPVVLEDDTIVARHMLYLSLSFDHRLVDGAEGARFTSHVIELLEEPDALLLDL